MRGGIARMSLDRLEQRFSRLVVVALCSVEHGEVVVRLGKGGIIDSEGAKDLQRLVGALLLDEHQSFEKTRLGVPGLDAEALFQKRQRLLVPAAAHELLRLGELLGGGQPAHARDQRSQSAEQSSHRQIVMEPRLAVVPFRASLRLRRREAPRA